MPRVSAYAQSVEKLLALGHELHLTPSAKFDLAHMRVLLEALGHPERRFAAVLIAGTNGKGSTAAFLAAILHAGGYRVGLYTSPHLISVTERIRIGGHTILPEDFARWAGLVKDAVERPGLPQHHALDIDVILGALGRQLVDDEVLRPAGQMYEV